MHMICYAENDYVCDIRRNDCYLRANTPTTSKEIIPLGKGLLPWIVSMNIHPDACVCVFICVYACACVCVFVFVVPLFQRNES